MDEEKVEEEHVPLFVKEGGELFQRCPACGYEERLNYKGACSACGSPVVDRAIVKEAFPELYPGVRVAGFVPDAEGVDPDE